MTTVREILADWLHQHGYDGLYECFAGCACELDDLIPCGSYFGCCEPGVKRPCTCGEGCPWHIGPREAGQ